MTTGEPISEVQGKPEIKPQEAAPKPEAPFANSLKKICADVFIGINDSSEEQARKKAGGFFVKEYEGDFLDRMARMYTATGRSPTFENLVAFAAVDHSFLKTNSDKELRCFLYKGAEVEVSQSRVHVVEHDLLGKSATVTRLTIEEEQKLVVGLEAFQKKLLARAADKV